MVDINKFLTMGCLDKKWAAQFLGPPKYSFQF